MKKSGMSVGSGRASIRAGSAISGQSNATRTYVHTCIHINTHVNMGETHQK